MLRAVLIGFCLFGIASVAAPSSAFSEGYMNRLATELSAKKKKKDLHARRARQPVYVRHWFRDPSLGPDGRPYRNPYPPGTCSTDLGYGRFGNCDSDND
jgi:hypothetical protein